MNHTMVAGNLGTDPEVRYTSDGKKVTTLRVASNSKRSGKEETTWWRLTIWGDQFDRMMQYIKKGSSIMAFGEMQKPEIYNDREGKPQISLNLTVSQLSFSPFGRSQSQEGNSQGASAPGYNSQPMASTPSEPASAPAYGAAPAANFSDDEIPF